MHKQTILLFLFPISVGSAYGEEIVLDNFIQTLGVTSFGEPPDGVPYIGQTFVALGDRLDSLSFFIRPDGPRNALFRVLVTEVSPLIQPDPNFKPKINPTAVLYESADLSLFPTGEFQEISLDLGQLALSEGSTYGFVLDAYTPADGLAMRPATLGANKFLYDDGRNFYYASGETPGDRDSQFADTEKWVAEDTGLDLAFRMTFTRSPSTARELIIDVRPRDDKNEIELDDDKRIRVAVLTTDMPQFDAVQIDSETVRFGPTGSEAVPKRARVKDIDRDGDADLLLVFRTRQTGITCEDTEATLTGSTFAGVEFNGADRIVVTGCSDDDDEDDDDDDDDDDH